MEAALLDLPSVRACVILVQGEEVSDKHLVAFIVLSHPHSPDNVSLKRTEIRSALKARLPHCMVPAHITFLNRSVGQ